MCAPLGGDCLSDEVEPDINEPDDDVNDDETVEWTLFRSLGHATEREKGSDRKFIDCHELVFSFFEYNELGWFSPSA